MSQKEIAQVAFMKNPFPYLEAGMDVLKFTDSGAGANPKFLSTSNYCTTAYAAVPS